MSTNGHREYVADRDVLLVCTSTGDTVHIAGSCHAMPCHAIADESRLIRQANSQHKRRSKRPKDSSEPKEVCPDVEDIFHGCLDRALLYYSIILTK